MPVKTPTNSNDGMYFITFTCYNWLPLFQLTNAYDTVYKWFDYLKTKGHYINSFVIMPNHLHLLIGFRNTGKTINSIISNGKRFMAYEIVHRLSQLKEERVLQQLAVAVTNSDKKRGKLHQVFEPSFDWKECRSSEFIRQKLSYIYANPCKGIWNLATNPAGYPHSSAKFYLAGEQGLYPINNYLEMDDINLTK